MEQRKTLFDDPAFEKTAIVIYLSNTLSLKQLLAIESLTKSGKIRKVINGTGNSEQSEQNDVSSEQSKILERTSKGRLRHMIID